MTDDPFCVCDGVSEQSHFLFECTNFNADRNIWRCQCQKAGMIFSMNGIKNAIDGGKSCECLKLMVECTIEMNDGMNDISILPAV